MEKEGKKKELRFRMEIAALKNRSRVQRNDYLHMTYKLTSNNNILALIYSS
jgi:hypothetical protein